MSVNSVFDNAGQLSTGQVLLGTGVHILQNGDLFPKLMRKSGQIHGDLFPKFMHK